MLFFDRCHTFGNLMCMCEFLGGKTEHACCSWRNIFLKKSFNLRKTGFVDVGRPYATCRAISKLFLRARRGRPAKVVVGNFASRNCAFPSM